MAARGKVQQQQQQQPQQQQRQLQPPPLDPKAAAVQALDASAHPESRVISNITDAGHVISNHIVICSLGEISLPTLTRLLLALRGNRAHNTDVRACSTRGVLAERPPTIVLLQRKMPHRRLLQRIGGVDDVYCIQVALGVFGYHGFMLCGHGWRGGLWPVSCGVACVRRVE